MDLKLELMKRGISQIRMAHDLGIHQSRLSNIVNGWVKPTRDQRKESRVILISVLKPFSVMKKGKSIREI